MIQWLVGLFRKPDEPDSGFPDFDFTDRTPLDADCPDTQPTSPGALESLEDAMKTLILTIVILTLTGCATLAGVEISDEERKACERDGCTVWTKVELEMLVREAMKQGYLAGKKAI